MFGERIKKLRDENMHTQDQLASALGVSRSTISNYESEERAPDIYMLNKIATLYNVSIDYIIGRTDVKNIDEYVSLKSLHQTYKNGSSITLKLIYLINEIVDKYKNHDNFKLFVEIVEKLRDIFL